MQYSYAISILSSASDYLLFLSGVLELAYKFQFAQNILVAATALGPIENDGNCPQTSTDGWNCFTTSGSKKRMRTSER